MDRRGAWGKILIVDITVLRDGASQNTVNRLFILEAPASSSSCASSSSPISGHERPMLANSALNLVGSHLNGLQFGPGLMLGTIVCPPSLPGPHRKIKLLAACLQYRRLLLMP